MEPLGTPSGPSIGIYMVPIQPCSPASVKSNDLSIVERRIPMDSSILRKDHSAMVEQTYALTLPRKLMFSRIERMMIWLMVRRISPAAMKKKKTI